MQFRDKDSSMTLDVYAQYMPQKDFIHGLGFIC